MNWRPDGNNLLVNGVRCSLTAEETTERDLYQDALRKAIDIHFATTSTLEKDESSAAYAKAHAEYHSFAQRVLDRTLATFSEAKQVAYKDYMRTGRVTNSRYSDWLSTLDRT